MQALSIKSDSLEFKPWNSPFLLSNQFEWLAKIIAALNAQSPPQTVDVKAEIDQEFELKIIHGFSHPMMRSWLALAKSYYPFYKKTPNDYILIEALENKLKIKATDYESLSALIKNVFLTNYPKVHSEYQLFIDNIKAAIAQLTAVVLSTPALINDAHQRDMKRFEEAGPSVSNCIGPIETILNQMMSRAEVDKCFVTSSMFLILQVKTIKSHFEQMLLIQQLESITIENKRLQKQLEKGVLGVPAGTLVENTSKLEEQDKTLQLFQSKKEQLDWVKVFKLQKRVTRYYTHLTEDLAQSPKDKEIGIKLASMLAIKKILDEGNGLPSQKIKRFETALKQARDQLKRHRHPMWLRFLRDSLRILGLTCSGVAMYRTLSGQPVNFFKPSHGQKFVEEADHIINFDMGLLS